MNLKGLLLLFPLMLLLIYSPTFSELQKTNQIELFKIARNKNANVVSYNVIVSSDCTLNSETPFYAYWKMYEKGKDAVEKLSPLEEKLAYGIRDQIKNSPNSGSFRTKALEKVQLQVALQNKLNNCTAETFTIIENTVVELDSIYIFAVQTFPLLPPDVKYIDFVDLSPITDSPIVKRLRF